MCIRSFHPIGQGAFYSEKVMGIRTVYDCGTWYRDRASRRVDRLITGAFPSNEVIDILFISHFDYDHVGKIPLLLETYKVKRIVMPLLEPNDSIFIAAVMNSIDELDLSKLIGDPIKFGEERNIKIIQVRVGENANAEEINLDNLGTAIIDSSTRIRHCDWVWIPYNYDSKNRSSDLFSKYSDLKHEPEKLKDTQYFKKHRKSIANAYKSISGNINENSLFLYSGPIVDTKVSRRVFWFHSECHYWRPFRHKHPLAPGCVFTGDGDLNKVNISHVYQNYFHNVGTIQIPHHGAKESYNEKEFDGATYYCPISFGVNNDYGHPSNYILTSLIESGSTPLSVTEKTDSFAIAKF